MTNQSPEPGDDEAGEPLQREATPRSELWLYAGAAVSYVVVGFFVKQIFAWWWFGAAWFIAFVWLVPQILGRGRNDSADDAPEGSFVS